MWVTQDAARGPQPSAAAGPSRSAAAEPRTAGTGGLLTSRVRLGGLGGQVPPSPPTSEAVDRLLQAMRARQGLGQPQQGGDQTPALTAPALRSFPPPAPRRTRYQARLRRPGVRMQACRLGRPWHPLLRAPFNSTCLSSLTYVSTQ